MSERWTRLLRIRGQRLWPRSAGDPTAVVREVCGVQAQQVASAALSVRVRSTGLTGAGVTRARVDDRSIVRTWCMRGTLHLVATEDLGWLLPLFPPPPVESSRRYAQLGLDADTIARATRLLRTTLASGGPLTRAEIVERLGRSGVDASGQRAPHLLSRAARDGLVCQGPDREGEPTYVLLADWLDEPPRLAREPALAELTRRYLAAYGPADPRDLAAWSGLPMAAVRAGWKLIGPELSPASVDGQPSWVLAGNPPPDDPDMPVVRLLPAFDTYLLGYRTRELSVPPEHARRVWPGGGWIKPALLVDGQVAGLWSLQGGAVVTEPFADLPPAVRLGIEAEAADVRRFLRAG